MVNSNTNPVGARNLRYNFVILSILVMSSAVFAFATVANADDANNQSLALNASTNVKMFRLYNPYSGEHFYTENIAEKSKLLGLGWNDEGVGWYAPSTSNTPVYRLYNPYNGDHHYTMNKEESDYLDGIGWNAEGVGWYSDDNRSVKLYRQFNPYNTGAGSHNYTVSKEENDFLASIGWQTEGEAWYGIDPSNPVIEKFTVYFDSNGGSSVASQTVESGQTAKRPDTPTKDGYTFEGWYSDSALTSPFYFSSSITANTVLYAKWEEIVFYTVIFNSNGGSDVVQETVESGKVASKPENPAKGGKTFVVWCTDEGLTMAYNFTSEVSGNLTLFAKWQSETLPTPDPPESAVTVYRMINQTTGWYYYTIDVDEVSRKAADGWVSEGLAWYTPEKSGTPVYRLYNPYNFSYHFTSDKAEYDNLGKSGWTLEGIAFYAADLSDVVVYRLYNPYTGDHFFTADVSEYTDYAESGWVQEGQAWCCVE